MKIIVEILVTLILLLFSVQFASACSCTPEPPPNRAFRSAPYVFVGTVTQIRPAKRAIAVRHLSGARVGVWERMVEEAWVVSLSVREMFKGVRGSTIELVTKSNTAACGYPFEIGQSYLVYAYKRANAAKTNAGERLSRTLIRSIDNINRELSSIETSYCSRTNSIKNAEEEVNLIRRLSKSRKPDSRRRSRYGRI